MLFDPRWRDDGDDEFVRRRNDLAMRINGLSRNIQAARRADPELNMQAAFYELNCAMVLLEGWRLDAAAECLRDAEQGFHAERRRLRVWRSPAVQARQRAFREFVETLRLHIPPLHPYGKMVVGEYLDRMRDAALDDDATEFARLAGMICKRVVDELRWHAEKEARLSATSRTRTACAGRPIGSLPATASRPRMIKRGRVSAVTSKAFFGRLRWLDGTALLDTMEPYRRNLLTRALDTRRADGTPQFNFVLAGRAKKNWKSTDLVLAALYCLTIREGGGFVLANDEDQAGDDLDLAKKLVACNPDLKAELVSYRKEIRRRDDRAALKILPSKDVVGLHGKTSTFTGFDEIHGYRNYDLFEALAPDPTRTDTLTWITSYDTIWSSAGIPLSDFKTRGKAGTDPRMLFSWYSGDLCTDPAFAELEPELRANPSIASFKDGRAYLDQQRQRLPTHKFRRLHLNLPGAPEGAYFAQGAVMRAVVTGRRALPFVEGTRYWGFIDMAGGGADDCVLAIGHTDADGRLVVDLVARQSGERVNGTYNPLQAVAKFVGILREYHITKVVLDGYAGYTFQHLLAEQDFVAEVRSEGKTEFYEALEVAINAGEVELLDDPMVIEQLLTLVLRAGGQKIDHLPGEHDDHANAVAGLVWAMRRDARLGQYEAPIVIPYIAGQPRNVPGSSNFEW